MTYDPGQTGSYELGIFGIPTKRETSQLVILPVPWEVTTSYGGGTSRGPEAILKASPQIDLFDLQYGTSYEKGYHLEAIPQFLIELNDQLRPKALAVREELENKGELSKKGNEYLSEVNKGCQKMADWVYEESKKILNEGRVLGLLGGDHSSPLGAIRAISEKYKGQFGILHIDAHADLREAYQGFVHSHASIMNNVMTSDFRPQRLVQVGIRDFCKEEYDFIKRSQSVDCFFDQQIKAAAFGGQTWSETCDEILGSLPQNVYISFDIDGLSPEFCPSTGTPVPGGLTFDQAVYLIHAIGRAGKKVVGFDLNEVAPAEDGGSEWDGNVGSRVLFKLCGAAVQP